jgi:hypothetical protein
MKERILRTAKIQENQLVAVYPFGSRVYGTNNYSSDYDFYVVARGVQSNTEFRNGDLNFHLYTPEDFQNSVNQHRVGALECVMQDKDNLLHHSDEFAFRLDLSILRREFSRVSSNSWVKAKKKLEVEHDYYIGRKSLWHSIRILMFGIQIAEHGKITDYTAANHLYPVIVDSDVTEWETFKSEYQPVINSLASEFRKLAPK